MKQRYVIKIAYDGMKFHGWQSQENAISIQSVIEQALSTVLREEIKIIGAGRTDTGVHATGQYAHFDTSKELNSSFLYSFNAILPNSISILELFKTNENFHARFNAIYRKYLYRIIFKKNPFELERALFIPYPLDLKRMQEAAQYLMNYKHFGSFCKAHSDNKTYFCEIHLAEWKLNHDILEFHIQANRFLRGMVRAIVGTLLEVGKKKITVQDFINIIESQDRKQAKMNVQPYGLYLQDVGYPEGSLIKINNEKKIF